MPTRHRGNPAKNGGSFARLSRLPQHDPASCINPLEPDTPTLRDRRRLPKHPPSCPPRHTDQQECRPGGAPSTSSDADNRGCVAHSQRRTLRQYAIYCSPNASRAFASSIGITTAFITSIGIGSRMSGQRLPKMIEAPA